MPTGSAVVDIRNSFGAIFVGLLFNLMLFGLELAQTWIYYRKYWHKDNKSFKLLIAFLILMDAMSSLTCVLEIYWHLVLNFSNVESLATDVWYIYAMPLFSSFPMYAVEMYYVRRAYLMSQSLICPIIVMPLLLFSLLYGYYSSITILILGNTAQVQSHTPTWLPCFSMGTNVFGDIMITATICWSLYRKRTGFTRTDSIITTLMVNTINSGFLLSATGTAMVTLYAVAPTNLVWLALYWAQSKFFVNSLLAMLNTRDYIRYRSTNDSQPESSYNLSSFRLESQNKSRSKQPAVAVTVHRSTASDFAGSKSDHTTGLALEDSKPPFEL